MMEIRQLKYFLAVANQRSFVNAANVLYISRQAVSKAVSQLEEELQVELFMRDSNGAFLTPAGVLFYDQVLGVVSEFERIQQEMQNYGARYRQKLRLAFSIGTLSLFEQPLIQFSALQKNADISYGEYPLEQCYAMIADRRADVAIVSQISNDVSLEVKLLLQSPFGVLLTESNPLAQKSHLTEQELRALSLAAHSEYVPHILPDSVEIDCYGYDFWRLLQLAESGRHALLLPKVLAGHLPQPLCWVSLDCAAAQWKLYTLRQRGGHGNTLSDTLYDELQRQIFSGEEKDGVDGND